MKIRAVLGTLAIAALALAAGPAAAQVKVGSLRCNVSGGLGLIITSSKYMRCAFTSANGRTEWYEGTIRKFGLDIGATNQGVFVWDVFAPTGGNLHGALAGDYVGAGASATAGIGFGANALIGGTGRSITLQPLSIEAQTGLNVAAGVSQLTLRLAR